MSIRWGTFCFGNHHSDFPTISAKILLAFYHFCTIFLIYLGSFYVAFCFTCSLQEAFAQLDLDGDGRLSRKEIEKAMGNVLSEADLNDLLNDLDTDQNGEVEWHEFLAVMKIRMREPESVKMLKEAFR